MKHIIAASVLFAALACIKQRHVRGRRIGQATRIQTTVNGDYGELAVKEPVHRNEKIRTSKSGLGEFLFRDGTKFAVGQGSDVKIDKFVFDDSGSNSIKKLSVKVSKGTFRWISGASKSKAYEIHPRSDDRCARDEIRFLRRRGWHDSRCPAQRPRSILRGRWMRPTSAPVRLRDREERSTTEPQPRQPPNPRHAGQQTSAAILVRQPEAVGRVRAKYRKPQYVECISRRDKPNRDKASREKPGNGNGNEPNTGNGGGNVNGDGPGTGNGGENNGGAGGNAGGGGAGDGGGSSHGGGSGN